MMGTCPRVEAGSVAMGVRVHHQINFDGSSLLEDQFAIVGFILGKLPLDVFESERNRDSATVRRDRNRDGSTNDHLPGKLGAD